MCSTQLWHLMQLPPAEQAPQQAMQQALQQAGEHATEQALQQAGEHATEQALQQAAEQGAEQGADLPTCRGAPVASSSAWCTAASTSSASEIMPYARSRNAPQTITMRGKQAGDGRKIEAGVRVHACTHSHSMFSMGPCSQLPGAWLLLWDGLSSEHNCNSYPLAKQCNSQGARWLLKAAAISAALSSPEPSTSSSANTRRAQASQRSL